MCVALDYAKAQHSALICNGLGDLLKGAFAVDNNTAGATQLVRQVRQCAKERKIRPAQVFFGGEDCPAFAENFLRQLRREKFLVVRVNAWEAKQQRSNFVASSDSLDLLGIARCCLNRRGEPVRDLPAAYANLRIATRDRDQLVRDSTALTNRIHSYVDRLFPGFLTLDKSGIAPLSQASLDLMSERFSSAELSRRPVKALAQWLGRRGLEEPQAAAAQLKELAKATLGPAPEQTVLLQRTLSQLVALYRGTQASVAMLDRELAYWLARTPGALLTSIAGIGVTLAAGWTAELGPLSSGGRCVGSAPMPEWLPKPNKPAAQIRSRSPAMRNTGATNGSRMSCSKLWKKCGCSARRSCVRPPRSWKLAGLTPPLPWPNGCCAWPSIW